MTKIQEINWGNFKAKFNGKEQNSFEWLCYLLFCKEFDQNIGISRYKNHAGIETDPIKVNGEKIGWQAKFYDTRLSEHKQDFIASIDTTKTKHPDTDKIIFYTNQDFGQGKKRNNPQYKIDIEKHAETKSIKIDWRTASFFESLFVCKENASIAQHFFSLGGSVIDFIGELTQHTESILKTIDSKIMFSDNEIKINRSQTLKSIKSILNDYSLIILSGEAGVGKTAIIKDFHDQIKNLAPCFVFKATELNIPHINQLLQNYGGFTLSDFIKEYEDIDEKYIVIDSAEKLSDIEDQQVFQEFLSTLLDSHWKIIFTTRLGYLDDLRNQLIDVYNLTFQTLNIENLTTEELEDFSKTYKFNLPNNERLHDLLHIPFYLNEYLQNYGNLTATISYSDFKSVLWNKQISRSSYRHNNTHIKREDCFLKIAQKRANGGHFFVKADDCDDEILQKLEADEIIGYDTNAGGYFITHDIYEEWALDRIIERVFHNSNDYKRFYQDIGSSLPIRRAFRNWLSEKLFINKEDVKSLIESTLSDDKTESYWKDEILVSVLLSDYSETFIQLFESKLVEDNQKLLVKVCFLLRIACKEIDESFLNLLGIPKADGIALGTLFTKPKGEGWNCVIDFISRHKEEFGLTHINIILPLLDDWNSKTKTGKTTKQASQIALFYYNEITKNDGFGYSSRDETRSQLIRVILQGASEICAELEAILDQVVSKNQTNYKDRYYPIIETILTSITDSFEVIKSLPDHVIKLADLFWFQPSPNAGRYENYSIGVEKYFGLSQKYDFDYFRASALQTPIFQLLRFAPKETTDFILSFTNKSVECYAKSELNDEVEEVEVFIDETKSIKQYISNRLWNMYRGTQVSTHLLESMHMALEKWLLENAKSAPKATLDSLCLYLIKNSKSASITAVVTSVVLAQPSKLFNIAKILFQTKEFFLYDTGRMQLDQTAKSHYSIGYGLNYQNKIFQDERIKTCEDKHRQSTLEHLALNYQFFRGEEEGEEEAKRKQAILWKIFDRYCGQLPDKSKETESDKTWRLYLARMDRRKMNPTTEEKDGQILISFNPDIDPELRKFSEESLKKSSDAMKYIPLKLWSNGKFEENEGEYKQYQQYENNPKLVIAETKEIIEGLRSSKDNNFSLFNDSIPAYTCAVLIRDYFDKLNAKERELCKEVIVEYASLPLHGNYEYQISDGVEVAVNVLPLLFKSFRQDKDKFKTILLLLLFDSHPIGMNQSLSDYSIRTICHNLWKTNFEDAHSIFLGYLLLKPAFDSLREVVRKENYKKNLYVYSQAQVLERFVEKYENELEKVVSDSLTYDELKDIDKMDLGILKTAFELLPLKTENEDHKKFLDSIFPIFSKKLFIDDDRTDYTLKHRFLEKFAYFILTSKKKEIEKHLNPFVADFTSSRDMADFFQEFISVEDRLDQYEEFWIVWNAFYEKIIDMCKDKSTYHYTKEIVHNYLLAWPYWKEDAKEWHTLKEREKLFFKKVAEDIGHHPSVLYSISKILNDIGSKFIEDGIDWISKMLQSNQNLFSDELETNTIYYLENIARRYVFMHRHKIRTSRLVKDQVIIILNFLIERGSIAGYLLREDIL